MRLLATLKENLHFHPLHYARKTRTGRLLLHTADRPVWISLPLIRFKVRGKWLSHGVSFGTFGPREQSLALACLERFRFQSFWDIGANFGYYAWLLKSSAPDIRIVLVEPLPENAQLIRDTINRNRFTGVQLVEAGASDACREGTLHADTVAGLTSSLNDEETFEQRHFGVKPKLLPVQLVSLDSMREQYGPVDFLKIDVEGHEAEVLRGAQRVLAQDQPVLFLECSHPGRVCLRALESLGYLFVDADTMSATLATGSINFCGFPAHKHDAVESILTTARLIR